MIAEEDSGGYTQEDFGIPVSDNRNFYRRINEQDPALRDYEYFTDDEVEDMHAQSRDDDTFGEMILGEY